MKLTIGCPVYKRGWVLPEWNQRVLSSVYEMNQEVDLSYVFVASDEDVETVEMLASFDTETRIKVLTEDRSSEKRQWGPPRYEHLVSLRNHLLAEVRDIQPDLFLSLDSDVLLAPNAISSAIDAFEDDTWAVGLALYMTEIGTDHPSNGTWSDGNFGRYTRRNFDDIITCDIIMAGKLMSPKAYNVDYEYHHCGEDLGWSRAVKQAGGKFRWDGRVKNKHVMRPEMLSRVDPRAGF